MPNGKFEQPPIPSPEKPKEERSEEKPKIEVKKEKIQTPEELGIDIRYAAPEYFEEGGPLYEWAKNEAQKYYKEEITDFIKKELLKGRSFDEIVEGREPSSFREEDKKEYPNFLAAKELFKKYYGAGQPQLEVWEEVVKSFKAEEPKEEKEKVVPIPTPVTELESKDKIKFYDYEAERLYNEKEADLSKQRLEAITKGDEDLYRELLKESIKLAEERIETLKKQIQDINQRKLEEQKRAEEHTKMIQEERSKEERLRWLEKELLKDADKLRERLSGCYEIGEVIQAPEDPDDPKSPMIDWKVTEVSKDGRRFVLERKKGRVGWWIIPRSKYFEMKEKGKKKKWISYTSTSTYPGLKF